MATTYGHVARFKLGTDRWCYLVSHPDDIAHILQADNLRYCKGKYQQLMRSVVGDGLLISNGERWRALRQRFQPVFAKNRTSRWLDIVNASTAAKLTQWEAKADGRRPLDIAAEMMGLVQEIIVKILFGRDVEHSATATLVEAISTVRSELWRQVNREALFGGLLNRLPWPGARRYQRAVALLRETVDRLITNHRLQGENNDSLMDFLEHSHALSEEDLRDQLITFFIAGHETTACALAWAFDSLAGSPEVAERVHAEVAQVFNGVNLTADVLAQLAYTRQVINESMRLMPPVYAIGRRCLQDDGVGTWRLRAGSPVIMSQFVVHRHPDFWDSPDQFLPDRFAPKPSQARPRYAFFPFGGGARVCIGMNLAEMEMTAIVARVLHRYRLNGVPGHRATPQAAITLRPRAGVLVTLTHR